MLTRRPTRQFQLGDDRTGIIRIGGDAPVSVQTMTAGYTWDIDACVAEINRMTEGSVIVDVAVDQGGCIATCRPTTHDDPTFIVGDVVHYCVANMPGAVPRTSTVALTNTTLAYALALAGKGLEQAARDDLALAKGINIYNGDCVYQPVSVACDVPFVPLSI